MAQAKKIYQATKDFIRIYRGLKEQGQMPRHEELCHIMGITSMATLSEILAERQNIQPLQWQRFKSHFRLGSAEIAEISEVENTTNEPIALYAASAPGSVNSYLPELLRILKKQNDILGLLTKNLNKLDELDNIANTQKLILAQLKSSKPVKSKKEKKKASKQKRPPTSGSPSNFT